MNHRHGMHPVMKATLWIVFTPICLLALIHLIGLFAGGASNPSVDTGQVGYVTDQPFFFGEKGKFLDVIVGPSSYGIGWRNQIKYEDTFKPRTEKEHFTPVGGTGEDKERDSRILSRDQINMELSVSVVWCLRHSPALPDDYNEVLFKESAKDYFENYFGFWVDRYQEPFRTRCRNLLGSETYASAKANRDSLGVIAMDWLNDEWSDTPLTVLSVNISNINPPARMLAEQEQLKATEIAESRQAKEKSLQDARKSVLAQEAENVQNALDICPKFLEHRDLTIQERYVEAFHTLITGDEAKAIQKVVFVPYNTPVTATTGK